MMRIFKVFGFLLLMCLASLKANAVTKGKSNNFDWNKVMDAITAVESGGNPRAKSG